jgi:hypothetical protein
MQLVIVLGVVGLIAGFSYAIFRSGRAAPYVKRLMSSPPERPGSY